MIRILFVLFFVSVFAGAAYAVDGATSQPVTTTGDKTLDTILLLVRTSPALAITVAILYVLRLAAPFLKDIFKREDGK